MSLLRRASMMIWAFSSPSTRFRWYAMSESEGVLGALASDPAAQREGVLDVVERQAGMALTSHEAPEGRERPGPVRDVRGLTEALAKRSASEGAAWAQVVAPNVTTSPTSRLRTADGEAQWTRSFTPNWRAISRPFSGPKMRCSSARSRS